MCPQCVAQTAPLVGVAVTVGDTGAPADGGGRAAAEITADEALRLTGHSPAPIARDCAPGPGPGGTSVTTPGVHGHGRTH